MTYYFPFYGVLIAHEFSFNGHYKNDHNQILINVYLIDQETYINGY